MSDALFEFLFLGLVGLVVISLVVVAVFGVVAMAARYYHGAWPWEEK